MRSALEKLFHLHEAGTSPRTELLAGFTTFMTMAYIIFVNPAILANVVNLQGLSQQEIKAALGAATCVASALPTLLMGLLANYPFALASGMGLNAFLAYTVVREFGVPWEIGMGIIVIEGLAITILVLMRIRGMFMNAIPMNIKKAIGVGIGIFITLIGLKESGLVVAHPVTLVTFGDIRDPKVIVSCLGLIVTVFLSMRGVRGALLYGIIGTTLLAFPFHLATPPESFLALPHFETIGRADILGALKWQFVSLIFAFMITDFFDTMGTVVGIGAKAGFLRPDGSLPRMNRVLFADSVAAAWGGFCGSSSTTTYVESAAGVESGGRTGLTSLVVAAGFLLALFFSPLVGIVPPIATAPALIVVGYYMIHLVTEIDFHLFEEGFAAFITILTIPLTFSIARGIGYGFILYTILMLTRRRWRELSPCMVISSLLFLLSFVLE